jgi:phage baseplate assembly protein W
MALEHRVDFAFTDDFQVSPTGDLDTVSGLVSMRAAILRRLLTKKGSLAHRPDYGIGLGDFQNAPMTLAMKRQLAQRIADQLPRDPDISSVESVSVTAEDNDPSNVKIKVVAKVLGYGEAGFEFTPFSEVNV